MTRALPLLAVLVLACSRSPEGGQAAPAAALASSSPSAPSAAASSTPGVVAPTASAPAAAAKLRAEIVPVIGGLYPVAKVDPKGVPAKTTLVLRVHNDGEGPVVLRTGGDDEGFEIKVSGKGDKTAKSTEPCTEIWMFGKKQTIAAHGHLDVPLAVLASGPRCGRTAHYLTEPGLYQLDIALRAHVHESEGHDSEGPPGKGERGTEVLLTAPRITVSAA